MIKSLKKIAEIGIKIAEREFLKVAPPKIATAATAVTLGQCGINLDMATTKMVIKMMETLGLIFENIIIIFWQK